jgi:hypothetical protein
MQSHRPGTATQPWGILGGLYWPLRRSSMSRSPRRFAVHLHLSGGQSETVMFPTLDAFQQWYSGVLNGSGVDAFVNVPISDLEGEYLVLRPSAIIGIRVEPRYSALDDE